MSTLTARLLARAPAPADGLPKMPPDSAYRWVEPHLVLGHEATIALLIERLRRAGKRIRYPERCFFAADHFTPPATAERAGILKKYLEFVEDEGVPQRHLFQGISHQLMVEDARCLPGAVIVGADSHTTMAGALGAFAAGFGSTDILAVLATGAVAIRVPEAIRVRWTGALHRACSGKDLALDLMRRFGEGGAAYRALEFVDSTDSRICMADRLTVCNLAVDAGAKNGVVIPDEVTLDWLRARDGHAPALDGLGPGDDADYADTLDLDVTSLEPLVARPGSPADVIPAREASQEKLHQVFIGSCAGGRFEDLRDAAEVLRGHRVRPTLRLVVTPASQAVYRRAVREGVVEVLIEAGAMVTASACGACGGIDKGLLADGEVCISTSNRNFRGRMGSTEARIYLASARTAAASALAGRVVDPREFTP